MSKKDGMYLYSDWLAPLERLERAEVGELIIAMMKYFINGEKPPRFEGLCGMAADFIFPQIDRSMEYARLGSRGGIATRERTSRVKEAEPVTARDGDDGASFSRERASAVEYETAALGKKKADTSVGKEKKHTAVGGDEAYIFQREESVMPAKAFPSNQKESEECRTASESQKPLSFEEKLFKKQCLENNFYKFWREYPKKIGKQQAMDAFYKLDPDWMLLQRMLDALKEQKKSRKWKKDDGQYIPYPENWIEGRRWEDELTQEDRAQIAEDESWKAFFDDAIANSMGEEYVT
ncbi:MAG: hypothetical protein IKL24_03530 [Clostridia bacterium]|nr:hypothetical protein [Clostridia bacterium]